jgi:16S rRNA G527 N7-methylase RsmG
MFGPLFRNKQMPHLKKYIKILHKEQKDLNLFTEKNENSLKNNLFK